MMRKLKLLVIGLATFNATSMFSINHKDKGLLSIITETQNVLFQQWNFPNLFPNNETFERIEIIITTNKEGKVEKVDAKTGNEFLKKEIEKQISYLVLPGYEP
ncbi:MAG: hypothetical protein KDD29_10880, partial [Flavobacteriales bacterium]|nr:hypothetical protein [Flavobacteriales bacterium]